MFLVEYISKGLFYDVNKCLLGIIGSSSLSSHSANQKYIIGWIAVLCSSTTAAVFVCLTGWHFDYAVAVNCNLLWKHEGS